MNSLSDDLEGLLGPVSSPSDGVRTDEGDPSRPVVRPTPEAALTTPESPMTESALGDVLGVGVRRIRQLVTEGVLTKPLHRRDSVRAYCGWLREKASRGVAVMDELKAEKVRQAREAADKLALQNAASRGEMVAASAVESAWSNVLRDVRSMMLAVPSRCGATLPHLTTHDVASIEGEIKAALKGLADDDT